MFQFEGSCPTIFQSGCTILYSHEQSMSDSVSLNPHQYLWSLFFLILVILIGAGLSHGFHSCFLSGFYVDFFLGLFVKCLFPSFAHLLIGLLGLGFKCTFFYRNCKSSFVLCVMFKYFLMSSLVFFFLLW